MIPINATVQLTLPYIEEVRLLAVITNYMKFPCPRSRLRIDLARRVRPSRPASSCLFSTLRLNLVLTHGIPTAVRGGVHIFKPPTAIAGQSRVYLSGHAVAYRRRSLPRVRRHRTSNPQGTVVPVTSAACSGFTMDYYN